MQEERAEDPPGGGLVTFDELIRQMEGAKGLGALRAGGESTGALWRSLYSCCMIVADRAG